MLKIKYIFIVACLISVQLIHAQGIVLDGYAYESDNRGFLNEVKISVMDGDANQVAETFSDLDGHFVLEIPIGGPYSMLATKNLFESVEFNLSDASSVTNNKHFFKLLMARKPGYLFDITLANKRDSGVIAVDAIHDSWIEVYNNTSEELEYEKNGYSSPNFLYTLTKGNHYTILIRKEGYLAKRIEAFVDVKGCILCIEGLNKLTPGVTDNLTQGNEMGTLLANVEMERVDVGTTIKIENLYYELGQWKLSPEVKVELDKVVQMMRDNPLIEIEIGSHTDSRGDDDMNVKLSQKRATEVVQYLISDGNIAADRLKGRGFGDTQLVNGCDDGIPCSDVKHAENRRTEMRITGIRKSETANKTLKEIKAMEKMDEMIRELQNQDVIKVKDGEELPDEIKKEMEDKKNKKKNKN